jgi:membrane carboxypeptidase/penicillin-binding protein
MLELSTAYSVFANSGQRVDLNPILAVFDSQGKLLESAPLREVASDSAQIYQTATINDKYYQVDNPVNTRVISPGTAFLISHILYDNGARAATFGDRSYLNIANHPEVSVKTGTTNDKRDNWTIGYNPDILAAVWVGNNDNSPMSSIASGVSGASPIWNKITAFALKTYKQNWPIQPAEVTGTLVCSLSGLKAVDPLPPGCSPRYEYFLQGTLPAPDAGNRRDIPIFRPTQAPATPAQIISTPDQIEYQNHFVIFDPLGTMLCIDCAGRYGVADNIKLDRKGKALSP